MKQNNKLFSNYKMKKIFKQFRNIRYHLENFPNKLLNNFLKNINKNKNTLKNLFQTRKILNQLKQILKYNGNEIYKYFIYYTLLLNKIKFSR